ncbi:unnamed protein product [Thelazia callipaeda]|uniref:Copper transport protein n=1 Tax=Thelazia callipaeda TaxID=103827 RepID=A0A0N5D510_THECL|nr:unnamed protein product [Thelazia callipaeda]
MNHDGTHGHSGHASLHNYHMDVLNSHSMDGHHHNGHNMKMWFHAGYEEIILFEFWHIESFYGLLLSCALIFILACLYEAIKWFRVYLQISIARCPPSCRHASRDVELLREKCVLDVRRRNEDNHSLTRLMQASLYMVQLTLAYWLMLIAMTYNVWLTAAVITGAAFGHWLFAVSKCFNPQTDQLDAFAADACH